MSEGSWRCSTKDCPWPDDRTIHRCWAQGQEWHQCSGSITHQHYPKKGMGGHNPNSVIVAILDGPLHDCIDNGFRYQGKRLTNTALDGQYMIMERDDKGVGQAIIFRRRIPEPRHGAMWRFCTTPDECGDKGYCPKELSCDD